MIEDKKSNKYNIGKIYTIRCYNDDKLIYVGSTVQPLYKAWNEHKSTHKNENSKKYNKLLYVKMREIGIDSFYIELHENCNCNCIEELKKKVGEIIRNIGTLNKTIYGREQKEYRQSPKYKEYIKEYLQSPKYKEYIKKYEQTPKRKEYRKEYTKKYEQTTERKEYIKKYEQTPERKETKKEYQQKSEYKEYQKEYQQKPEYKEYQKEYQKKYRQLKKSQKEIEIEQ
jgi:hypothetical protein